MYINIYVYYLYTHTYIYRIGGSGPLEGSASPRHMKDCQAINRQILDALVTVIVGGLTWPSRCRK